MAGALFWGLVVGSASLIGAGVGYFANLSHRVIGTVMGFGSGVLISALAYDLIEESYRQGGFLPVSVGFLAGACLFLLLSYLVTHIGGGDRKCCKCEFNEEAATGVFVGTVLDNIPEAIAVGASLLADQKLSVVLVAGFLSAFVIGRIA